MTEKIGATEAVEILFDVYADDIYRFARYSLRSTSEAEDVVQEVFLRVMRGWTSFQGNSSPKTWLWRIARNYIIDVARKRNKQVSTIELNNDIDSYVHNVSEALEIEDYLDLLEFPQRQVVTLRLVQEMSTTETAQILGWTEAKVRTTLHRAVSRLRRSFADAHEGDEMHGI